MGTKHTARPAVEEKPLAANLPLPLIEDPCVLEVPRLGRHGCAALAVHLPVHTVFLQW